jgi:tripartite-type tricarboxylate transporter receptor subunit TctC
MQYGTLIYVFGVLPDSPWKTFKDFVGEARKNPGKLKYTTPVPYGGQHIFMEQIFKLEKAKVNHIPVKGGSSEATRMVLGGHVDAGLTADFIAQIREGKIRGLAVQQENVKKLLSDVPTFYELGYDKVESPTWFGLCAPKGLDPRILKKLADAFKKAYDDPSFQELMFKLNTPPFYRDSEAFTALVLKDFESQGRILRELGAVK